MKNSKISKANSFIYINSREDEYKTFFTAMQKLEEMGELSELMPVYTHGIEVFTPKRAGKTTYGQLEVDLNTAVNSDTNAISFFVLACRL